MPTHLVGQVATVGPDAPIEVPPEATRIEGAGKFLMPGLAEMHGHLPSGSTAADALSPRMAAARCPGTGKDSARSGDQAASESTPGHGC